MQCRKDRSVIACNIFRCSMVSVCPTLSLENSLKKTRHTDRQIEYENVYEMKLILDIP